MTTTTILAIYGASLATIVALWDIIKYILECRRLRLVCYIAQKMDPNSGKIIGSDLLVFNIANTGGKPILINSLGWAKHDGKNVEFFPTTVKLPNTLKPGESATIPCSMPENIEEIKHFYARDGLNKLWKTSTLIVKRMLINPNRKMRV